MGFGELIGYLRAHAASKSKVKLQLSVTCDNHDIAALVADRSPAWGMGHARKKINFGCACRFTNYEPAARTNSPVISQEV